VTVGRRGVGALSAVCDYAPMYLLYFGFYLCLAPSSVASLGAYFFGFGWEFRRGVGIKGFIEGMLEPPASYFYCRGCPSEDRSAKEHAICSQVLMGCPASPIIAAFFLDCKYTNNREFTKN